MADESSDFKPLPRRSANSKRRKRQAVGAGTPSAPRRTARARAAPSVPPDGETMVRPVRRRRARRKSRLGWLGYLLLALFLGTGVYVILNLQASHPPPPVVSAGTAGQETPPLADELAGEFPTPPATPGSIFEILKFPELPTRAPTVPPTPIVPEVAIVAGHWAKESNDAVPAVRDSGAVCPDGLREVDITKSVADKTLALMERRGYHALLLEEFDPRYQEEPRFAPRVFLSIHADSCLTGGDYAYATGYKIAHAEPSENELQDNRLVTCLTRSFDRVASKYDKPFNANTITRNMTEYHAFRKINPTTPAAIIELGFLGYDREFLVNHQDEMARGLAVGLDDFLKGNSCLPPTATPAPTETTLP